MFFSGKKKVKVVLNKRFEMSSGNRSRRIEGRGGKRKSTNDEIEYDAFIGKLGKPEGDILATFAENEDFVFMPNEMEPTVKIDNYFFLDGEGNQCSMEDVERKLVLLHGIIRSWDGSTHHDLVIGNVEMRKWYESVQNFE